MGPLTKLASMIDPRLGEIYKSSLGFGQQFPRHNDNGPGDAMRHAYATARVANLYGPTAAKMLGGLYELTSLGQDRRSQAMDEHNNAVGLEYADMSDAELREALLGALNEGRLKTLPKGVITGDY